jgi:hypothetical protein
MSTADMGRLLPAGSDPLRRSRLSGQILRRQAIDPATRESMFQLLSSHFEGVDPSTFNADLAEKDCAILLEDEEGVLRGFSTLTLYGTHVQGRRISVVYSGDTIIDRAWWGSPALPRTWIRAVRQLAAMADGNELYWLLLTSGFRTYRFLPVFFRTFYPCYDDSAGDHAASRSLLDALAIEKFGDRYDRKHRIVRFARPQVLTRTLLELRDGRTEDPHIAYFLARNPGHVRGDELACLALVHDRNLTAAGRRMARGAVDR